jgi:hypothetical protein
MDIFETKSENIRAKLAGMRVDSVDSIGVSKDELANTRCLIWSIKDEFGIKLKSRYKDGVLYIKRVS